MTDTTEPTEQTSTSTTTAKTEKTFTQKELDAMVQARLDRAESGFKKERDAWDAERTSFTAEKESLQGLVEKSVFNIFTTRMSQTEKTLFDSLPFEKKLEFVQDEKNVTALNQKTTTPVTPTQTTKSDKPKMVPIGG